MWNGNTRTVLSGTYSVMLTAWKVSNQYLILRHFVQNHVTRKSFGLGILFIIPVTQGLVTTQAVPKANLGEHHYIYLNICQN